MKNIVITVLAVLLVGLGGWLVYSKFIADSEQNGTPSNSDSSNVLPGGSGKVLDYSNKGLTSVGPDIYNRSDATVLLLSDNSLTSLPSEMGKMTRLETLKLDHNKLENSLIAEIRKMPLKHLSASYNNMTGIPAEIGQLTKLEVLDYSHNKIDALPNEIVNLKQLQKLDLTGNPIPQSRIDQLKSELPSTDIMF